MINIQSTKSLTKQQWKGFYLLQKKYSTINDIVFKYKFDDFQKLFSEINLSNTVENYLVSNNNYIIGRIEINITKPNQVCNIRFLLLKDTIDEFILDEIFIWIQIQKNRFKTIRIETDIDVVIPYLLKDSFTIYNTILELRLRKSNFFPERLNYFLNADFIIDIKEKLTNKEILVLAKVYNSCIIDMKKNGNHSFSTSKINFKNFINSLPLYDKHILFSILKNKNGVIIGFTALTYNLKNNSIAEHFFTCIINKYRGNNFALLMKSNLYKYIFKYVDKIDTICTECFEINTPILKSNYKLGFKLFNKKIELIFNKN
ncbi:MAG TPA: hypothetical protein PK431_15645 [Chitinophagales bacterium]|nr:hypothetical protein [Chitinophagales bacterium]